MEPEETSRASSEDVRKRGNDLYKAGKLEEAVGCYKRAAQLAPSEPAPLSNLSAAFFELGDYEASYTASSSALTLLDEGNDAARQKLYLRQVKSSIHGLKLEQASAWLGQLAPSGEQKTLKSIISVQESSRAKVLDPKAAHHKIVSELPRYKPQIQDDVEYMTIGHDAPASLYDTELLSTKRKKISLLFGGIGDARNLHATIMQIGMDLVMGKLADQSFHLTIVDIKPAAIARDLLVLMLLNELGGVLGASGQTKKARQHTILACLYYTYLGPVMPRPIFKVLQQHTRALIDMLDGRQKLPIFLVVPQSYRSEVLEVLRAWQDPATGEFTASAMRKESMKQRAFRKLQREVRWKNEAPRAGQATLRKIWNKERHFFEATGVLPMPVPYSVLYDEAIRKSFSVSSTDRVEQVDSVAGKVDGTWCSNVTMIDPEWSRGRSIGEAVDLAEDPYDFGAFLEETKMPLGPDAGMMDAVSAWFILAATYLLKLKERLKIEACIGDVTAVLEQLRYDNVSRHEQKRSDPASPSNVMYDRIHLSNIPDYIGGVLSSFLYATPMTYPGQASWITSTCMQNPTCFPTPALYNNEYTALHTDSDIQKVFRVRLAPPLNAAHHADLMSRREPMPMNSYHHWHQLPRSIALTELMPRDRLATWSYRLFLKIAVPIRNKPACELVNRVYTPLNMTAFLRIVSRLHDAGYPAHWLSDILGNLLAGKIKSSARPPRSEPLKLAETNAVMPLLEQSIAPFVAELSTLLSIWQFALPFGLTSPGLPEIDLVRQYSVRLSKVSDYADNSPVFILVLYNTALMSAEAMLRPYLLSDEEGDSSQRARKVRLEGLHVVSTWQWSRETQSATFWLRKDVMDGMAGGHWAVAVWRTETWRCQSSSESIAEVRETGQDWMPAC